MLHSEDALLGVLVFRQEHIAIVLEVAITGFLYFLGVFEHFFHVFVVDMAHSSVCLIAITPCPCQVAFCQISSSGYLVGTSAFALSNRQFVVGNLEVGNHLAHQFIMSKGVVWCLLLSVVLINLFINPWHLVPQLDQLEVEMSAEETHFTFADVSGFLIEFVTMFLQRHQRTVATADGAIQMVPHLIHVVGRRCSQSGPHFERMVVGVGST